MRCPECSHRQKFKDGAHCQKCRYRFVFRRQQDQISDFTLRQIILRLSDQGHYAFTATQLALEICRLWRKKALGLFGCGLIALIVSVIAGLVVFTEWGGLGAALVPLIILPLAFWLGRRSKATLSIGKARRIVTQYHQAHPIQGLADGAAFRRITPPADFQEPHYAPERMLIVERDELVDLLVRNRFHLTAKAAIVSRTGYPEPVFAACQAFLRNHPNTPAQVLHDASLQGFALTAQLAADRQWRFAVAHLVDLGLSRTALDGGSERPWLPTHPARRAGFFGGDPAKRLHAGYRLPLDALGPKPLLNALSAAVISGTLLLTPEVRSETELEIDYG